MSTDVSHMILDLQAMKVDQLKLTIRRLNEQCYLSLRISGVKQELYTRCRDAVYSLAALADQSRFNKAKDIIARALDGTGYSPPSSGSYGGGGYGYQPPPAPAPQPAYGGSGGGYGAYGSGAAGYGKPALPAPRFDAYGGAAAGSSGAGGYGAAVNGQAAAAATGKVDEVPLLFRTNPFYKVERSLCGVTTLPRAGQGDRKSVITNFALTEPQRTMLAKAKASPTNPQYQVRLYCTSEDYFNPHRPADRQTPAPIDFPQTCEIKLNYGNVPANTKGIKKQVGTASPVDLAKGGKLDITAGAVNRLEVIYVNTEKSQSRRHFMVVYLVEVTTIKQLAERVKTGKSKSKEDVIASIIKMNSDPDMEASSFGVSLKDPLTLARIKTPIRSASCTHISCFDAEVYFMINEQTPTWTCPICSKVLRVEDLIYDGFFADVLQVVGSAEVDDITVEPDGTWRSDDDKFGTAQPKSKLPSRDSSVKPDIATSVKAEGSTSVAPEDKGKGKAVEALTLDSDDDDDEDAQPLAKRQRLFGAYRGGPTISLDSSPGLSAFGGSGGANGGAGGGAAGSKRMETIDLTLSDSEDDAPLAARRVPPAPAPAPAPIVNRAASHTNYAPPPPLPRPASAAGSASSGAGAAAPPPPPPPSNGMFAGGASAAETQEAMRRQMAEQALARHMADMRRRSELEREAEAEAEAEAAAAEDYGYEGEY